MLVSEDEASFLIKKEKKKKREKRKGGAVSCWNPHLEGAWAAVPPPAPAAVLCHTVAKNPFYNSSWGLPVQADLGFKEVSAPLSSAFNAGLRLPVSLRF